MNQLEYVPYKIHQAQSRDLYSAAISIPNTQNALGETSDRFIMKGLRKVIGELSDSSRKYNHCRRPNYFYDILHAVTNLDCEFKKLEELFLSSDMIHSKQNVKCEEENQLYSDLKYINLVAKSLLKLIAGLKEDLLNQVEVVEDKCCEATSRTNHIINDLETKLHELLKKLEEFKLEYVKEPPPFTKSMINVCNADVMRETSRIFQERQNMCVACSKQNRLTDNCDCYFRSDSFKDMHVYDTQKRKKRKHGAEPVSLNCERRHKIDCDKLVVNGSSRLSKLLYESKASCKCKGPKNITLKQDSDDSKTMGSNFKTLSIGDGDADSNSLRAKRSLVFRRLHKVAPPKKNQHHTSKHNKTDFIKMRKRAGRDRIHSQTKLQYVHKTRRNKKHRSMRSESEPENKTDVSNTSYTSFDRRKPTNKVLDPSYSGKIKNKVYVSQSSDGEPFNLKLEQTNRSNDSFISETSSNRNKNQSNKQSLSDEKNVSKSKAKHGNNSGKTGRKPRIVGYRSYKTGRVSLPDRSSNESKSPSKPYEMQVRNRPHKVRSRNLSKEQENRASGFKNNSIKQHDTSGRSFWNSSNKRSKIPKDSNHRSENNIESRNPSVYRISSNTSSRESRRYLSNISSKNKSKNRTKPKTKDSSKDLRKIGTRFRVHSSKSQPRSKGSLENCSSKNKRKNRTKSKTKDSSKDLRRTRKGFRVHSSKSQTRSRGSLESRDRKNTSKNRNKSKVKDSSRGLRRPRRGFGVHSSKSQPRSRGSLESRGNKNKSKNRTKSKIKDSSKGLRRTRRGFGIHSSKTRPGSSRSLVYHGSKSRSNTRVKQNERPQHKGKSRRGHSKSASGFGVHSSKSLPISSRSLRNRKNHRENRTGENIKKQSSKKRNSSRKYRKTPSGFSAYSIKSDLSTKRPLRIKEIEKNNKNDSKSNEIRTKRSDPKKRPRNPRVQSSVHSSKTKYIDNTSEYSCNSNIKHIKHRQLPHKTPKIKSLLKIESRSLKQITSSQNVVSYIKTGKNNKKNQYLVCLKSHKKEYFNSSNIFDPIFHVEPENQCNRHRRSNKSKTPKCKLPRVSDTKYYKVINTRNYSKVKNRCQTVDGTAQCDWDQYFERVNPTGELCPTSNKQSGKNNCEPEYELLPIHSPNLDGVSPTDSPLEIYETCQPNMFCQPQLNEAIEQRFFQKEQLQQGNCYAGKNRLIYKFPRQEPSHSKTMLLKQMNKIESYQLSSCRTSSEEEIHFIKQFSHQQIPATLEERRTSSSLSILSEQLKSTSFNNRLPRTKTKTRNETEFKYTEEKEKLKTMPSYKYLSYRKVPSLKIHKQCNGADKYRKESSEKVVEYEYVLPTKTRSPVPFHTPTSVIQDSVIPTYHSKGTSTRFLPSLNKRTSTNDWIEYLTNMGTNTPHVGIREQGNDPMPEREKVSPAFVKMKTKFTNTDKTKTRTTGTNFIPGTPKPKVTDTAVDPLYNVDQKHAFTNTVPVKDLRDIGTNTKSIQTVKQSTKATDPLYYLEQRGKHTSTSPINTIYAETQTLPTAMTVTRGNNPERIKLQDKPTSYDSINKTDRGNDPIPNKDADECKELYTESKKPTIKSFYTVGSVRPLIRKCNTSSFNNPSKEKRSSKEAQTQTSKTPQTKQPDGSHCIKQLGESTSGLSVKLLFEKCHDDVYKRRNCIGSTNCLSVSEMKKNVLVYEKKRSNTFGASNRQHCNKRKVEKKMKFSPTIGLDLLVTTKKSSQTNKIRVNEYNSTDEQDKLSSVGCQAKPKLSSCCGNKSDTNKIDRDIYVTQNDVYSEVNEYRDFSGIHVPGSSDSMSDDCNWKVIANEVKDDRYKYATYYSCFSK